MIDPADFTRKLHESGVSLFTGVPDSLLKEFGAHLAAALPSSQHVIAANEGNAVAIAIGHHLRTGGLACVYMQNSGLGNAINPLLSLADPDVYSVPMVLLIGWRGQPGTKDEPQHLKQGRVTVGLVAAMGYECVILPRDPREADVSVEHAVKMAVSTSSPFAVLVEHDTFEKSRSEPPAKPRDGVSLSREEALCCVAEQIGGDALVVSTTGMLSRELFELREGAHLAVPAADFLTVGGMGHASSIALGVSMAEPDKEVWCLDGDGALLMHAGALAVIGQRSPRNFFHVVFDNAAHDSVGGQPTAIDNVNVVELAKANGYAHALVASTPGEIVESIRELRTVSGPALLQIMVRKGSRADLGRPTRTPRQNKAAFMAYAQGSKN